MGDSRSPQRERAGTGKGHIQVVGKGACRYGYLSKHTHTKSAPAAPAGRALRQATADSPPPQRMRQAGRKLSRRNEAAKCQAIRREGNAAAWAARRRRGTSAARAVRLLPVRRPARALATVSNHLLLRLRLVLLVLEESVAATSAAGAGCTPVRRLLAARAAPPSTRQGTGAQAALVARDSEMSYADEPARQAALPRGTRPRRPTHPAGGRGWHLASLLAGTWPPRLASRLTSEARQ